MTKYDVRNYFPEIIDDITIIGNLQHIFKNNQDFITLRDKGYINEYGYDGEVQHIKMSGLFTIDDVRNKIDELVGDKDEYR